MKKMGMAWLRDGEGVACREVCWHGEEMMKLMKMMELVDDEGYEREQDAMEVY